MESPVVVPPGHVVEALAQLNTHARAYGCGKKAIYAYKTLVAGLLVVARQAQVDLVEWRGKCRDCDGTGRYHYVDGGRADHCWKCNSTGMATLKFVTTVFPDGLTWHHPFDTSGREIAELAGVLRWDQWKARYIYRHHGVEYPEPVWFPVGSWTPGDRGERLGADDAAQRLNLVEAWVLRYGLELEIGPCRSLALRALESMREYVINIGRAGATCWYCESTEIVCGLSRPGPPFHWSAPVCVGHQETPVALWPHPRAILARELAPALREWFDRHERIGFKRAFDFD